MPTIMTQTEIGPTTSVAELIGPFTATQGRTVADVAQELYYRELFDYYLARQDAPGEHGQSQRRELLDVLLRRTKDTVHEVARRAAEPAALATSAPTIAESGAPGAIVGRS